MAPPRSSCRRKIQARYVQRSNGSCATRHCARNSARQRGGIAASAFPTNGCSIAWKRSIAKRRGLLRAVGLRRGRNVGALLDQLQHRLVLRLLAVRSEERLAARRGVLASSGEVIGRDALAIDTLRARERLGQAMPCVRRVEDDG